MPTAVMSVTAEMGFNFTPAIPRNPANSTLITSKTATMSPAAHGLHNNNEITTNTASEITPIACSNVPSKCRY